MRDESGLENEKRPNCIVCDKLYNGVFWRVHCTQGSFSIDNSQVVLPYSKMVCSKDCASKIFDEWRESK